MVSAPKEAAGTWCKITARKHRVTKYLRSLILTGRPVTGKTHEVTI
jgi:hypothetical protein